MAGPETAEARLLRLESLIHPLGAQDEWIKAMLYGPPGVGKTYLAATCCEIPEFNDVLLANAEAGQMSIKRFFPQIENFPIDTFDNMNDLHWYLMRKKDRFRTVIIDTITELQKKSMDKILKDNFAAAPSKHDPDVPQLSDWGKNTEQMRKIIRVFRDLPMHVIFVCHSDKDRDETTGAITITPAVTPKLKVDVCGFVDFVIYLDARDGKDDVTVRSALTRPTGNIVAKSRAEDRLAKRLVNPRFSDIWGAITGKPVA